MAIFANGILVVSALMLATSLAEAQVSRPTPEEAKLSEYDIPGGTGFRSVGLSAEPGLADPRDFSGTWNLEKNTARFFAMRARGGGPGAAPPPGPSPDLLASQKPKLSCIPSGGPAAGGDGPVEIIQTATQLTWMAEEMHAIRRIYLNGEFTPGLAPSYNGEAIGRFDGDVLVIETRGMSSLPPGARMIERLVKTEQGRKLENDITTLDASGQPMGAARRIVLFYRPNERMLEWLCEDYGEVYAPGGYDRAL